MPRITIYDVSEEQRKAIGYANRTEVERIESRFPMNFVEVVNEGETIVLQWMEPGNRRTWTLRGWPSWSDVWALCGCPKEKEKRSEWNIMKEIEARRIGKGRREDIKYR